jgi:hypothetical protein
MNAYELADGLDDIDAYEKHQTLLGKSAETLRQQQVEIETLKKEAALQRLSNFTQEADFVKNAKKRYEANEE